MNPDYVKDVYRFGSGGRLKDEDEESFNVSHDDNCRPDEIRTDGRGNIIGSPLIWRKPCIGRPERHVRGLFGGKPLRQQGVQQRTSETPCDRCQRRSPGVFEACARVVDERIASNPAIEASFETWMTARGDDFGSACFIGHRLKPWRSFLDAIIDHGGWANCNDDQVKLEALRRKEAERKERNAAARAARKRQRVGRHGAPNKVTNAYIQALQAERDRRSENIKGLRCLSGQTSKDMLWLKNLPDDSCDRIADVWWSRELLSRVGHKITGKAIAEHMTRQGRSYELSVPSLTTRVYDDLKRIAKFEDKSAGAPIWKPWMYSDPTIGAQGSQTPVISPP
jgi:hypothetical protein